MNEHSVPGDAGRYLFEFNGKQPLREAARWIAGVGLAGAGLAIVVIGTASQSFVSVPLGIATAVLGAIVLFLYAISRNKAKQGSAAAHSQKNHVKSAGKDRGNESIASQLALIAALYSQGALTPEEFVVAKRRILDL